VIRQILIAKSTVRLFFLFVFALGVIGGIWLDFREIMDRAQDTRRSLEETSIWEPP